MHRVRISARVGSPRELDTQKGSRIGMIPSRAMAWRSRGAPVRDWRPAPIVERKDPIRMTHSFGHAMFATTSFPPIDWPNLWVKNMF